MKQLAKNGLKAEQWNIMQRNEHEYSNIYQSARTDIHLWRSSVIKNPIGNVTFNFNYDSLPHIPSHAHISVHISPCQWNSAFRLEFQFLTPGSDDRSHNRVDSAAQIAVARATHDHRWRKCLHKEIVNEIRMLCTFTTRSCMRQPPAAPRTHTHIPRKFIFGSLRRPINKSGLPSNSRAYNAFFTFSVSFTMIVGKSPRYKPIMFDLYHLASMLAAFCKWWRSRNNINK